jgi:hypothetical protein
MLAAQAYKNSVGRAMITLSTTLCFKNSAKSSKLTSSGYPAALVSLAFHKIITKCWHAL